MGAAMPAELDAAALARFDRDGFLLIAGALDPRDFDALKAEYEGVVDRAAADLLARGAIADAHPSLPFGERVAVLAEESDGALHTYLDITLPQKGLSADLPPMSDGPAVFGLLTHPGLLDIAEAALGCGELLSNPTQHIRVKPPASRLEGHSQIVGEMAQTVWHQDLGTVSAEADDTAMLTLWIPISPSTEENGCLLVAPGSHRRGLVTHERSQVANYSRSSSPQAIPDELVGPERLPLPMMPGDVCLLHRETMHASLPNLSDDIRWSVDIRYNPVGQATGRPWFPSFIARSRSQPERELRSAAAWREMWCEARARLIAEPPDFSLFQRWPSSL